MTVDVIHGFSEKSLIIPSGIGFSEKIDFRRVVRLALASGSAAADLISHLSISPVSLCVTQPPL